MGRALLLSLLLVGSGAAAQTPGASIASRDFRLPPPEGMASRLPKAFDFSPTLRFDGETDCRAYIVKIAALALRSRAAGTPTAPAAKPDERLDGCFVMRRETTNPLESPGRIDPDRMI